jgi:ribose 1,5-bisphosphokinase
MAHGALVLVVGPSGAGKDTLIAAARAALADDAGFVFPRRVVTRPAVAELEDHDTMGLTDFTAAREAGAFALDWQAHGLCYGIPSAILDDIATGKVVVVNTSRAVVTEALRRFPDCRVVLVTARTDVRAARLAGRGRESAADVAKRLEREGAPVPTGIDPVVIDNSGTLEAGIAAFVDALRTVASH